jgi:tRNA nucleotidyltransferase (CCA-adding enzyme)
VASARLEYYKFPAALPTVEMSSIKLDLYRRDFTINTLAISLNPDRFGTLIDFFNALRDIKDKSIRVLHNLSFVEDPTRVFRAIRFEQRFGFNIGKLSSKLIDNAVSMDFFKRLSGKRVFSELRQILEEENPTPSIIRLAEYSLLSVIHPSIALDNERVALLEAVQKVCSWKDLLFLEESYKRWIVYFLALIKGCNLDTAKEICRRFELPPKHRKIIIDEYPVVKRRLIWLERTPNCTSSELYTHLIGIRIELLLFMLAAAGRDLAKKRISRFIMHLRHIRLEIQGRDLIAAGITPGPLFKDLLDTILKDKLDGAVSGFDEERRLAGHYYQKSLAGDYTWVK